MPAFMVMVLEREADARARASAEIQALLDAHAAYEQKLRAAAVYLDGERLRPAAEARRVSRAGGQLRVDAGPAADQVVSAYYVVEAPGLAAAVALAEACPLADGAELDVRPVAKSWLQPDKTHQQGRVFAFAVSASARSEPAWIDAMDQIDDSTRGGFPPDRFRGGARLAEPSRGRRVTSAGGRRADFDGPFLESKEVIGGFFFLRMASVDEAVEWASHSAFVRHGAVEIRELWRS